jgi:hypothetical protein
VLARATGLCDGSGSVSYKIVGLTPGRSLSAARRLAVASALAACVVAGCGGGSASPTAAVESTYRAFVTAYVNGNGAAACQLLTAAERGRPLAIVVYRRYLDAAQRRRARRLVLDSVRIRGDTAIAKLPDGSVDHFAKVHGKWLFGGGSAF